MAELLINGRHLCEQNKVYKYSCKSKESFLQLTTTKQSPTLPFGPEQLEMDKQFIIDWQYLCFKNIKMHSKLKKTCDIRGNIRTNIRRLPCCLSWQSCSAYSLVVGIGTDKIFRSLQGSQNLSWQKSGEIKICRRFNFQLRWIWKENFFHSIEMIETSQNFFPFFSPKFFFWENVWAQK